MIIIHPICGLAELSRAQSTPVPATTAATTLFIILHLQQAIEAALLNSFIYVPNLSHRV